MAFLVIDDDSCEAFVHSPFVDLRVDKIAYFIILMRASIDGGLSFG